MRKLTLVALLALGLLLPVGCGGGGGDGIAQYIQQLRGCSEEGLGYLVSLTLIMEPVVDAIEGGGSIPGLIVEETNEAQDIWSYSYLTDLDHDGIPDTTVSGTIDFSEDPTDGIAAGSSAVIVFAVAGEDALSGDGTFFVDYGNNDTSTIYGEGELTGPDCYTEFLIPEDSPITLALNGIVPSADIFGSEVYGSIGIYIETDDHDLEAVLTMTMGSETVQVSDVEIDGVDAGDFSFDVDFDEEALGAVFECAFGTVFAMQDVLDTLQAIANGILSGSFEGNLQTFPSQGGNPLATGFIATYDGNEIEGTVVLGGIPLPNAPIMASVTFNFDSGQFRASATAGNPLVIRGTLNGTADGIDDILVYGRVLTEFRDAGGEGVDCDGTITIPSTNPLTIDFFDSEGGANEGAVMLIDVNYLGNNLKLAVANIEVGENTEFYPVGVLFNNLPIPFSLLGFED